MRRALMTLSFAALTVLSLMSVSMCVSFAQQAAVDPNKPVPTLYIIGDSTVKNGTAGLMGWGDPLALSFDSKRIHIVNRARGGRSSRTYRTEGLWDKVLAEIKPGDYVLMQFGHNDGGSIASSPRASLKGTGE